MLQLRIGRDGRQIAYPNASSELDDSTISTFGEGSSKNMQNLPSQSQLPKRQGKLNASMEFSVLSDIRNIQRQVPLKGLQIRDTQIRKIQEILLQLKGSVNAYRYLEKQELKAKQNIYVWFHEAEKVFLSALSGNYDRIETQKIVEDEQERSKCKVATLKEVPKMHPSLLPNQNQQEDHSLRLELQTYRLDRIEEMKKIQEVSSLVLTLNDKYKAQKKANQALNGAMGLYITQCNSILQRITAKYHKENAVTTLERQVQQVLTKLKFKTFDYHYRS